MKEEIIKALQYIGVVALLAILIKVFFLNAPMVFIFTWVAFIVLVPLYWERYKGGPVSKFWGGSVKTIGKMVLAVFLFLLIRAYFTHIVDFAPFESWANITTSTGVTTFFGHTPIKLLYEATFLLLIGGIVLEAVYKKSVWAYCFVGLIVVTFFIGHTMMLSGGNVNNNPLKQLMSSKTYSLQADLSRGNLISKGDNATYGYVQKAGPVYQIPGKTYTKSECPHLQMGHKVLVVGEEVVNNYGEPLVKIILSNQYGDFVGGEVYLFPQARLGNLETISTIRNATNRNMPYRQASEFEQRGMRTIKIDPAVDGPDGKTVPTMVGYVKNGDVIKYISPKSFVGIINPATNNLSEAHHNQSAFPREIRCFKIYGLPEGKWPFAIKPHDGQQFEMEIEIIGKS